MKLLPQPEPQDVATVGGDVIATAAATYYQPERHTIVGTNAIKRKMTPGELLEEWDHLVHGQEVQCRSRHRHYREQQHMQRGRERAAEARRAVHFADTEQVRRTTPEEARTTEEMSLCFYSVSRVRTAEHMFQMGDNGIAPTNPFLLKRNIPVT